MAPADRRIQLQEAFKLALSVTLFYWIALSLLFPSPKNGIIAIAVTSLATVGESFNKGVLRVLGTALGVTAGFVILSQFSQERWAFMLVMAAYVVAVAYGIQGSRHGYAWFLAGFTAANVWSSSYMDVDHSFRVGLFRFVETAGGVVVYTLVSLVLWPRSAGKLVDQSCRPLLENLRELFGRERSGDQPDEATLGLRASIAASIPKLEKALDAAYSDTRSIRMLKPTWRALPGLVRSFGETLQLYGLSRADCRALDLAHAESALDAIDRRLDRIVEIQEKRVDPGESDDPAPLAPDTASLSHGERARLMIHFHELERLDEISRELLRTVRVLAGLDDAERQPRHAHPPPRAARWDPERFLRALFPALSFFVCYFVWIYTNPPAGNAIPMIGIVFGLLLMLMPMNLFKVLKLLLIGMTVVSPIYMFLLPSLDSGAAMLTVVFVSTFLLGLLGGRLAMLRTVGLICFAIVTNITNRPSYSFLAILYPMIMLAIGSGIVMATYWFVSPMQPERVLVRELRRFFRRCASILRGGPADRSDLLAADRQIRNAQMGANYDRLPDGSREGVQEVEGALQLIMLRLDSIESTVERSEPAPPGLARDLADVRDLLTQVFARWSRRLDDPAWEERRAELEAIAEKIRGELDRLVESEKLGGSALQELWALLGGVRGLVEAVDATQTALRRVQWDQWTLARF